MSIDLHHRHGNSDLPELDVLEKLIQRAGQQLRSDVLCEIENGSERFPIHCVEMGSRDPAHPAVGFFGGVHGVERIGTQVLLAFLHALIERQRWDDSLQYLLQRLRLVFVPLANPGGMINRTRCNPRGVDLMRNSPVDADHGVPFLLGGQRLSRRLPWYRGRTEAPMEPEAQAICRVAEERLIPHAFSLSIDCHSGFGTRDRIWFPYAGSRKPIDCLPEIYALRSMFRATHPYHSFYIIEPQSRQYTTHGDLWDYLYDRSRVAGNAVFVPLTLEMGSWLWVKKSPIQIFNLLGMFNPLVPHRHQRTLRRHLGFLDFLTRAAHSHARWKPPDELRHSLNESAMAYWYRAGPLSKQDRTQVL